jgi:predicted Zn-dependent protease
MKNKDLHDLTREEWLRHAGRPSEKDAAQYQDEFSRRAVKGLRYAKSSDALKDALHRLDKYAEQKTKGSAKAGRRLPLVPRWLSIAAGLLVVVTAALFIWTDTQQPPASLFEEHFAPIGSAIPLTGNLRTTEAERDLKRSALREYENGQYPASIEKFQQYLELQPEDHAVRLYYGIALMADGRSGVAAGQLETVYHRPPTENYRYPAGWYLALAHLQLDEPEQAIRYLKDLANQTQSTFYRNEAESLLQAIPSRGGATK